MVVPLRRNLASTLHNVQIWRDPTLLDMNNLPSAWFPDASDGLHRFDGAPLSPSLDDIFKSDGDVSGGENARADFSGYHGLGQVRAADMQRKNLALTFFGLKVLRSVVGLFRRG